MKLQAALRVRGITKRFGGIVALHNVALDAQPGEITGLIGQNGSGKSTLLDIIAQRTAPDSGTVEIGGVPVTGTRHISNLVGRSFQQLHLFPGLSVMENVLVAFPDVLGESLWREMLIPAQVTRQRIEHANLARQILEEFGLLKLANEKCASLSYGLQKMLSLARLKASGAPLLLLDEPTSGLSGDAVETVMNVVRGFRSEGRTVVLVEHDMEVMFSVCKKIVVMNQGEVLATGSPSDIRAAAQVRRLYFGDRVAA